MWSASTSLAQPEREQLVEEGKTLYQEYLKNKTKVKEYWRTDVGWDGFIGALEQNRRAIESAKGVEVTHREPPGDYPGGVRCLSSQAETSPGAHRAYGQVD